MMLLEDDDDKYWLYQAKFLDFLNKILPKKLFYVWFNSYFSQLKRNY